ncbi:unnamed protein product [Laminaria digitata]
MSSLDYDLLLFGSVFEGEFSAAKAALQAGANVNGHPDQPFPTIVAATITGHVGMVELLLEQGADPDRPVVEELPCPDTGIPPALLGERALHIAARSGSVEIVTLLLERAHADVNATDSRGCPPISAACEGQHASTEVVRLLLEAGADPAVPEANGFNALHIVAVKGHTHLVDMLYRRAPATLNTSSADGATSISCACYEGHEGVVSKLLALGAMLRMPRDDSGMLPLGLAVDKGFVGVVRVLMKEGGIKALGAGTVFPRALFKAIRSRQAKILRLLLTVDGEEGRSEWANTSVEGRHLLHYGAGYCYPAAVSVLLEAGADEAARDLQGRTPGAVIGRLLEVGRGVEPQMVRGAEVAIRRMLQRGLAYRARSWAWPSDEEPGDGDTAGAAGGGRGGAAAAAISSPPAMKTPPVVGVRIFRSEEKGRSKFFVRFVGRYCAKE